MGPDGTATATSAAATVIAAAALRGDLRPGGDTPGPDLALPEVPEAVTEGREALVNARARAKIQRGIQRPGFAGSNIRVLPDSFIRVFSFDTFPGDECFTLP